MHFLDLPDTVTIMILEYLSYDEVAKKREVCRRFNQICQQVLNAGLNRVVYEHSKNFKRIKALLPRRESERRNHCLARHADILTSIETRISMLSMTYSKYIEHNFCCFIPGRVLDEIIRILRLISTSTKQLRPHEVLQELRDISSMAIEHFDDKIAVNFKTEHLAMAKLSPQSRATKSLGDISFSGASNQLSGRWNVDVTLNHKPQTSNIYLDAVAERVNKLFALGFNPHRHQQQPSCPNHNITTANVLEHGTPPILPSQLTPLVLHNTEGKNIIMEFKQFKSKYNKNLLKVKSVRRTQIRQERMLKETTAVITELSATVSELKRQVEDIIGNISKHSLQLKQEFTAIEDTNSDVEIIKLSNMEETSTSKNAKHQITIDASAATTVNAGRYPVANDVTGAAPPNKKRKAIPFHSSN